MNSGRLVERADGLAIVMDDGDEVLIEAMFDGHGELTDDIDEALSGVGCSNGELIVVDFSSPVESYLH